ncbi:MAG: sterol desaturase family protein [Polyangiales bacterium]
MRDYIALAIPFFFLLIGLELWLARRRDVRVYRVSDALTDIHCGVTSQMGALLYGALQLSIYAYAYQTLRLVDYPSAWMAWLVAFVGVDFAYYWWHRLSHEVNFLWAAHIVHHQSEDYNFAVALRQSVLTSWTSLVFYLPLALLGVPPLVFAATLAFSTLYQFWIHTQLFAARRGIVDYVFNLPSHHRVHHAVNPRYLDKNYGATLIVWDRWFGTYEPESEPCVYGITKPLASFNPLWAQVHYWFELADLSRRAPRMRDKVRVWLKPPWWRPEGLPAAPVVPASPATVRKYDAPRSRGLDAYLLAQHALLIAGATALIFQAKALPHWLLGSASAAVVLGVLSLGGLMEHKRWAPSLELGRVAASCALLGAALLL